VHATGATTVADVTTRDLRAALGALGIRGR
jgi:hypothetical protein